MPVTASTPDELAAVLQEALQHANRGDGTLLAQINALRDAQEAIGIHLGTIDATLTDLERRLDALEQPAEPPGQRFPGDPGPGLIRWGSSFEGSDADAAAWQGGALAGQPYRYYEAGGDSATSVVTRAGAVADMGMIPFPSLKLPGSWASVAAGDHDEWLADIAAGLAMASKPVWLTLHHEPLGDGDPADYRAMYAHAVPLMREHAGGNVAFGPVFNGFAYETRTQEQLAFHVDWPLVDFFGFDLYNAWPAGSWREFRDRASFVLPHIPEGMPWIVGEFGCREDPSDPARGALWLHDAHTFAVDNGAAAMCYFNSGRNSPDGPWILSGERLAAWLDLLSDEHTAPPLT